MSKDDLNKSTYYPGLQKIVPGKNKAVSHSEIVVDEQGEIITVSNSFLKDSGFSFEEVKGKRLTELLHPSELEKHDLIDLLRNTNELAVLLRVRNKNKQYLGFLVSLKNGADEKEK